MTHPFRCGLAALAVVSLATQGGIASEPLAIPVAFDRWMYPFNATPGVRASGSVFGAVGSAGFDNRDAQIVLGFDLAGGELPSNQMLQGLTVETTTNAVDTFIYDPTVDPLDSYLSEPDADAGRPLEMFGVGTRNGFTRLTSRVTNDESLFQEATGYSTQPGVFQSTRSAFAADYQQGQAVDVSNNVTEGVAVTPWAVGQTPAVTPGATVPMNTTFAFTVDLLDTDINAYVSDGLARGELFFAITGLHSASQGAPATYPSFYLDADGASLGPTARLLLTYTELLTGDFDRNGLLNEADIELLNDAIRQMEYDAEYDLNLDQAVDENDRRQMIEGVMGTWFGDADLDGQFNSNDLVTVLQRGEYENQIVGDSTWSDGDWNGDREFGTADFVAALQGGGYERGPRPTASTQSVPEPTGGLGWILGLIGLHLRRRVHPARPL